MHLVYFEIESDEQRTELSKIPNILDEAHLWNDQHVSSRNQQSGSSSEWERLQHHDLVMYC